MIDRTSIQEVMKACHHAAPCLQGTMTALQTLMGQLNNFAGLGENADPDKNVDDLIPEIARAQDAVKRTNALLQVYLRQTADTQLKAEGKPSTPQARAALAANERFQKIHFSLDSIIEWMKKNRYVGDLTTKFTNEGVEGSIYSEEIAAATLEYLFFDVLMLDEVVIEVLDVDPAVAEEPARFAAHAALLDADARMAQELAAQLEREEAGEVNV